MEKKENFLCIHLPKELCHVGIGIKSSAAAASSPLRKYLQKKLCQSKSSKSSKGNLFCQQHLDVAATLLTDINMDFLRLGAPFSKASSYTHSALGYFQSVHTTIQIRKL